MARNKVILAKYWVFFFNFDDTWAKYAKTCR